ncbi:CHY zinc finger protein [Nesterenkonia alba]|uniref:CHY zinc finger protein n=1 Tax=Nesterenkonia alba TaxID=515814 RepID=UPI000A001C87|nr:CHY zinc finger protein [Nesterenkonia alba]
MTAHDDAPAPQSAHPPVVRGRTVDHQTRCVHYATAADVVAILFHCCRRWYPCLRCHDEAESHRRSVWPGEHHHVRALLCGVCGHQLSITEYRTASCCPECAAVFNPGCAAHWGEYFA